MVLIGLVFGALSGYGLSFLGLFGRIVCAGLLFLHAIVIGIALLASFLGRDPGDSEPGIGAGGLIEYLVMALGFDAAMIISGRLAGLSALDWRWAGGAAALALVCAALLEGRYVAAFRRHFNRG